MTAKTLDTDIKSIKKAARKGIEGELVKRVEEILTKKEVSINNQNQIIWKENAIARLKKGNDYLSPEIDILVEDLETSSKASDTLKKQEGSYFTTDVGYTLDLDKRNQRFQTTDGFQSKFLQTIPLISESNTLLNGYQLDTYHSYNDLTTSLGLYLRAVTGLSDDVRISERLNLPRKRLRGFESGKIGPVDANDHVGGNYAASLNFQTNLPFLFQSFQTLDFNYFIDAGSVWGVDYTISIGDSGKIGALQELVLNGFLQ